MNTNWLIDIALYLTYILLAIAIISTLGFSLYYIIKNIKLAYEVIIGILSLIILFIIAYFLASNEPYTKFQITSFVSKLTGGGLNLVYILLFVSIVALIVTEIQRIYRKQ